MPAASESHTISPSGKRLCRSRDAGPQNLARKNGHAGLCLAGETSGVFIKAGKGFRIFGKPCEGTENLARRTPRFRRFGRVSGGPVGVPLTRRPVRCP